ncbi:MAG TPA: twin transmembrane helix small protein [Gammaproteobacteria bacterium]|nr:twin transmembrane helix small protein [Gammaproteobacteria bacterium]
MERVFVYAKIIISLLLLIIIYCLGSAMYFMLSGKGRPGSMAKALTWRVILSLCVFLLLMAGFYLGWLSPHSM